MPSTVRLSLSTLSRPLDFANCPDLAEAVEAILRGWGARRAEAPSRPRPLVTFERKRNRYHWTSAALPVPWRWRRRPPHTVFSALCDIHYELSDWFVEENPGYFCLHCGAVRIGDGVVVFPSDQKAGKSVLTMQFAAAGHEVFGDDVLAITPRTHAAMSLGLLPRMRLPLPDVGGGLAGFVAARRGPANIHYQYVALRETEFAPFGRAAPILGFVLLDRQPEGGASVAPVGHGEALRHVIRKNFATEIPAPQIFNRLKRLTGAARRLRLTYSRGEDAIALLAREFG